MKICILTNWYLPYIGGAAINVHKICQEHRKRHEVTVLTPHRNFQDPVLEVIDGITVKRFQCIRWAKGVDLKTVCPKMFLEVFSGEYNFLVAYPSLTHNFRFCLLAALLRRIPVVLTVFDLMDYRTVNAAKFPDPSILEEFYYRKNRLKSWLFSWQLRMCAGVLAIAKTEVEFLRKFNLHTYLTPVHVNIHEFSGISSGEFRRKYALGIKPVVLSVGRIEFHKGQDVLVNAIPSILQQVPNAQFVFIGPVDDPDFYRLLQKLADSLGVLKNVIFTGPLDRSTLLEAYEDCDIHVAPVRFMNSGAITQEAWAAGKPVLQSDRVDPNHIDEGVNGFTFELDKPSSLVEKLLTLLSDPCLRKRLGENGRLKVLKEFDYAEGVLHLELLYAQFQNA